MSDDAVVVVVRDITDRVNASQDLERQVEERTREVIEQAQQLAAVEERQRLARELHDSVSQALYGIALGARTARTLLDSEPARAVEPVEYVLSLAEAGLAEMRALIFELRPESLETEGLVAALEKQSAATKARYGIEVVADLGEEPSLSFAQKEVFYRIAQEALHNVVKHAHATRAEVRLAAANGSVVLEVRDNGAGFNTSLSFPGHMGLVSMMERAASIGANTEIKSEPGLGTTVKLALSAS
jgi:signal transduction histidine kinase